MCLLVLTKVVCGVNISAWKKVPRNSMLPTGSASSFSFGDTCPWIISMPHSVAQRKSVISQLAAAGIADRPPNIWPGLPLKQQPELLEAAIQEARSACLVPPSYAADVLHDGDANLTAAQLMDNSSTGARMRWHGTIGSTLAHLQLLRHLWASRKHHGCTWALVLADDTFLLDGFKRWAENLMEQVLRGARGKRPVDLLNLGVVRSWGELLSSGDQAVKRVAWDTTASASADSKRRISQWPAWSDGKPTTGVKSPNLLVSAYMVRVSSLPVVLSAFEQTRQLGRRCAIDQVLARIEYALAASERYSSYNVDITRSRVGHCAVGAEEARTFARAYPDKHKGCSRWHPEIYGNGSRSHDRRMRRLQERSPPRVPLPSRPRPSASVPSHASVKGRIGAKGGSTSSAIGAHDPGCSHAFHVPGDRVVIDNAVPREGGADGSSVGSGRLTTKLLIDDADASEWRDLAGEAWKVCASAKLDGPYARLERQSAESQPRDVSRRHGVL